MLASAWLTSRAGTLIVKRRAYAIQSFRTRRGMASLDYSTWNAEQLVAKVQALEKDLKEANERYRALASPQGAVLLPSSSNSSTKEKVFDPSRYTTRMIALKFAYLGQNYNGLEYAAGNVTAQPTIEEALWAALMKGRLIFPTDAEALAAGQLSWEGCEYTKCGRTDKGVSAFGQVIGLRIRSNRPVPGRRKRTSSNGVDTNTETHRASQEDTTTIDDVDQPFHPVKDELPYVRILNRLLPPDIRALAWCSDLPEDFSARFSCRERRYRYFFTNPAFAPTFGSMGISASRIRDSGTGGLPRREGWLDIEAMQDAARRYEGLHDFRNLCKIDSSKQITDFRRRIFRSEIRAVDPSAEPAAYVNGQAFCELAQPTDTNGTSKPVSVAPQVYQFILHGSAFLWHQVRHMVAILFLVGQGLEKPDIVDKLMDAEACPRKPHYQMADDAPLVLWDCVFPDLNSKNAEDSMNWIYAADNVGAEGKQKNSIHGASALVDTLWETWRRRKIDELLAGSLLNVAAAAQSRHGADISALPRDRKAKVYLGGDSATSKRIYVPLMQRPRNEHFEVVNARYALKKGLTPKSEADLLELQNGRRDKRHDHLEDLV